LPTRTEPLDALLAIATDLLAQSEAQVRSATRLEQSVRHFVRGGCTPSISPLDQVRARLHALRDLFDAERALLDEFERQLSGAP
jgi:hypothetical protein